MKPRWKLIILAVTVVIVVASLTGVALAAGPWWKADNGGQNRPAGNSGTNVSTASATGSLDSTVEEELIFLREEEKLARDVYLALYDEWGETVFDNIAASEDRHMASVENLLDRYGLEDPVGDNIVGEFSNEDLQTLYYDLVAQGSLSLEDAYLVGVTIEEMDIDDLRTLLETDDDLPRDVTRVAENLLSGSENHLAAFSGLLAE